MDPKAVNAALLSMLDQLANAHEDAQDPALAPVELSEALRASALPRPAQVALAQARSIRAGLKAKLAADPQLGLDLALRVADFMQGLGRVVGIGSAL